MSSNEQSLPFYREESYDQFQFFFFILLIHYTLRLTIVCQVTSLVLEQFRKSRILENSIKVDPRTATQLLKDWF
jgi:hypothetical protein